MTHRLLFLLLTSSFSAAHGLSCGSLFEAKNSTNMHYVELLNQRFLRAGISAENISFAPREPALEKRMLVLDTAVNARNPQYWLKELQLTEELMDRTYVKQFQQGGTNEAFARTIQDLKISQATEATLLVETLGARALAIDRVDIFISARQDASGKWERYVTNTTRTPGLLIIPPEVKDISNYISGNRELVIYIFNSSHDKDYLNTAVNVRFIGSQFISKYSTSAELRTWMKGLVPVGVSKD